MIQANVIADSISPMGKRITTFECIYPRFILAEVNTHRVLSRNSASSRAIPVEKMVEAVMTEPAMPVYWGQNQRGMQAAEEVSGTARIECEAEWLRARDRAVESVRALLSRGLHKQLSNRLLEPWMHAQTVITATEWDNFYGLRTDAAAQPEFRALAEAMLEAHNASAPRSLDYEEWHLPFVGELRKGEVGLHASVARCCRTSYTNQGKTYTIAEDKERHDSALKAGHLSPFEHQATPQRYRDRYTNPSWCGNFKGWIQYRKTLTGENRESFARLLQKG